MTRINRIKNENLQTYDKKRISKTIDARKIGIDEIADSQTNRPESISFNNRHGALLITDSDDQSTVQLKSIASTAEIRRKFENRGSRWLGKKMNNTTSSTTKKSYDNITMIDDENVPSSNKNMSPNNQHDVHNKSPITMFMLLCLLILLLYALKRLIQYYLYYNRKSKIRRYFDFGTDPLSSRRGTNEGTAYSGDEFDELLVGVFENDDYTQFDDDDSDESIESILSQWSGKHSQGEHDDNHKNQQQRTATSKQNNGENKHHMEMVDLDLGASGGEGGIVSMDMDTKLNLHEQNG